MKKLIGLGIFLLATVQIANAQFISDNAIGLRFGDSDGLGTEISYQRHLWENNRLEANLGWRNNDDYNGFKLAGLYQWVWNLDGGFNWYAGAGGGFGAYDIDDADNETFVFVAGDVGIEYNFEIPILLSLDFRPELGFGDFNDDLDFDIALSIRYQF